jgi:hypothetical protein
MARPEGLEPPTLCLEGRRSIHLSYGRYVLNFSYYKQFRYFLLFFRAYMTAPISKHKSTVQEKAMHAGLGAGFGGRQEFDSSV